MGIEVLFDEMPPFVTALNALTISPDSSSSESGQCTATATSRQSSFSIALSRACNPHRSIVQPRKRERIHALTNGR